jgi:hypothetical protein
MTDHKCNDIRKEVEITVINTIIKQIYQNKWLKHLETMAKN